MRLTVVSWPATIRRTTGVDPFVHRQRARRLPLLELLGGQRKCGIENQSLVVEQGGDDVVIAGEERDRRFPVETGLQQHRVLLPPEGVGRVCGRPKLRAVEVVLPGGRHTSAMMSAWS
jgi:hypothetical protein